MTTGEIAEHAYRKAFIESLPASKSERIAWQAAADAVTIENKRVILHVLNELSYKIKMLSVEIRQIAEGIESR